MSDSPSSNQYLTDERLKFADDDFDAFFAKPAQTQALVRELVAEIKRLRGSDETTDNLAHIVGDIHEAVGEDRDSDHATLPVRIRQLLADLRNEISALEPPQRNVYTAMDYVGTGPLPNCDVCKQPYAAHDQTTYYCPA